MTQQPYYLEQNTHKYTEQQNISTNDEAAPPRDLQPNSLSKNYLYNRKRI